MVQSAISIRKTVDVNQAALQAMLAHGSERFLVTVHNNQIVSVALVGRSQPVEHLLTGAQEVVFPGRRAAGAGEASS